MDYMHLRVYYRAGTMGMPQDMAKANELYLKKGELLDVQVQWHMATWVVQYFYGDVEWMWIRRKQNISMNLQL